MSIYKPKDFAKMLNVYVKILQIWDNEDTLKAYRNPKESTSEDRDANQL